MTFCVESRARLAEPNATLKKPTISPEHDQDEVGEDDAIPFLRNRYRPVCTSHAGVKPAILFLIQRAVHEIR